MSEEENGLDLTFDTEKGVSLKGQMTGDTYAEEVEVVTKERVPEAEVTEGNFEL